MDLTGRLRHARNSLNLTLQDVAKESDIGTSTLSEFENGKREPRLNQLKTLADIYQRTISFFLSEEELEPEVVLWREKPVSPRAEELQGQLWKLMEQYHNLETWCDEHQACELPPATGSSDRYGYHDAGKLARNFRNEFALGERPGQSLLRILEEVCKVKVFHFPFEPTGSAACTLSRRFGAGILLNARHVRWRRNFDLAHELFHLLTWSIFRKEEQSDGVEASVLEERMATCFARNLLMPEELFRSAVEDQFDENKKLGFDKLFKIARQFDVSVEAVLWQISFVFNTPSDEMQAYSDRIKGQISSWDDRERDDPSCWPLRYRALARKALRDGAISAGRYAEYVGVSRQEAMRSVEQDAEQDAEVKIVNS